MESKKIIKHIVKWLTSYAKESGMKGYVVGVSGGVDSAVVSTLCAMTGLELLLLELPIRQKSDEVNRAWEHMNDLKSKFPLIQCQKVDLTAAFESLEDTFLVGSSSEGKELSLANTRSRLRMLTLYYYAQNAKLLVCGTGNKVEDFGIGFYTKYGDGGVDVSPIADLYKTEVYALARELGLVESIQKAIPTDGLWDTERTDEQQIGASYAELEKIQKEWGQKSMEDYSGRDLEVFRIFSRMNKAAQHKINPIPVCDIPEDWR